MTTPSDEPTIIDTDPTDSELELGASDDQPDPTAFEDEPWSDLDPEAFDDPEDVEELSVSFGGPIALADTSTRERWVQSALRALVAPRLGVDGMLGPRSTAAIARFQRRAEILGVGPLAVDGILGPATLGALETLTQSKATEPTATPEPPTAVAQAPAPTQAQPTTHGELELREVVTKKGATQYRIRAGDQEVGFSYWTPAHRKYAPYNVSRYTGALKGLVSDDDIFAFGYSTSELRILRANALKESGGAFGAINTWDNQIVSWGMAQFAGKAGTLAVLMARLKEDPRTRASFERWFSAQGIDVVRGPYPWKEGRTRTGWHVVVAANGEVHRGNEGWQYIRTQPLLIGAFLLAGNDPVIQLGQIEFWRNSFLLRAINKQVSFASGPGGPIRRYLTSERGLAIIVRLHNWMPANVVRWSNRFIAELEGEHPGRDLSDPFVWDQELEDAFVKKVSDERRSVKKGSYDTYALDLSRERGSFVGSEDGS